MFALFMNFLGLRWNSSSISSPRGSCVHSGLRSTNLEYRFSDAKERPFYETVRTNLQSKNNGTILMGHLVSRYLPGFPGRNG